MRLRKEIDDAPVTDHGDVRNRDEFGRGTIEQVLTLLSPAISTADSADAKGLKAAQTIHRGGFGPVEVWAFTAYAGLLVDRMLLRGLPAVGATCLDC